MPVEPIFIGNAQIDQTEPADFEHFMTPDILTPDDLVYVSPNKKPNCDVELNDQTFDNLGKSVFFVLPNEFNNHDQLKQIVMKAAEKSTVNLVYLNAIYDVNKMNFENIFIDMGKHSKFHLLKNSRKVIPKIEAKLDDSSVVVVNTPDYTKEDENFINLLKSTLLCIKEISIDILPTTTEKTTRTTVSTTTTISPPIKESQTVIIVPSNFKLGCPQSEIFSRINPQIGSEMF